MTLAGAVFRSKVLLRAVALAATSIAAVAAAPAERPNIVFVLLDDHRWDDLGCMGHPFVKTPHIDRIAREGARFVNAFVTSPLCSPSRGGFLTGQYASRHGIIDNTARDQRSHELVTFPRLLRDAGYATAFIGKWHMGTDDSPRPGFDHWVSVRGQGEYFDPQLNINGRQLRTPGYVTDLFTDHAVEYLQRPPPHPFCLFLAHKAVHPDAKQNPDGSLPDPMSAVRNFIPAERHKGLYADKTPPRRPNYGAPRDKPALQRKIGDLPPLSRETATDDETIRNRLRMLAAVDEGIGRMRDVLAKTNQLDRTLFILTSDEGYFYGEHGLSVERRLAYEESIRIPLLIRYPRLIRAGLEVRESVLNIDLAPTILELAGVAIPRDVQGRSIRPLLEGKPMPARESFLIEYFSDTVFPRMHRMGYKAVRTEQWKYIRYLEIENAEELYDLRADPYEQTNLVRAPAAPSELTRLRTELDRLVAAAK
jgi:N-acetylglucosamine-6-sulfatase